MWPDLGSRIPAADVCIARFCEGFHGISGTLSESQQRARPSATFHDRHVLQALLEAEHAGTTWRDQGLQQAPHFMDTDGSVKVAPSPLQCFTIYACLNPQRNWMHTRFTISEDTYLDYLRVSKTQ